MRVLLIEDDQRLLDTLATHLREAGYAVDVSTDGIEGLYLGEEFPIDLAIIDLGLPEMPGLEVIRKLRSRGRDFPILVLTARSEWQDKVAGLEAGADDYLTKPSRPRIQLGPVTVDLSSQRVYLNGDEIELTTFEYKVLNYLVMHPGEVVTKTDLSEHIYEEDADRDSNVIEVFIGRLRRKIDPDGTLNPIETLRGRGYRLTLEPIP
jgi:two-component system response regulator PhoP